MDETTIVILGIILVFGMLIGTAYALNRRLKRRRYLFTGRSSGGLRVLALLLGLLFGGIFVGELIGSNRIHLWPPILAVILCGYGFGAEKLLKMIQK
jgi:hypothetical protein